MAAGESNGGKIDKRKTLPQLFTPMTAKQAQEASIRARNLRKQVRAEMLDTVIKNYNFGEELTKALKKCDLDKVTLLKEAMRLIGLQHDQSEEAVQKIDIKSDNKVTSNSPLQIKFVDARGDEQ